LKPRILTSQQGAHYSEFRYIQGVTAYLNPILAVLEAINIITDALMFLAAVEGVTCYCGLAFLAEDTMSFFIALLVPEATKGIRVGSVATVGEFS
jgi:hypothetical protein